MEKHRTLIENLLGGVVLGGIGIGICFWQPGPLSTMGTPADCAFFLGLILLIVGGFACMRGSPAGGAFTSSSNSAAQGAFNANVTMEEEKMAAKGNTRHRRGLELNRPGIIMLVAGIIDLLTGFILGRVMM